MEITYPKTLDNGFFGRNGLGKASGLVVIDLRQHGGTVSISPLTSRGGIARCRIDLPDDPKILLALAEELTRLARGESFDPWGEDPQYPVASWRYEVANDDTRQGYWEWVEDQKDLYGSDHQAPPKPKTREIKATITIFNSRADVYGNRYWAFTWTDIATGKSVSGTNSGGNAGHIYREMGLEASEVVETREELKIRDFNRMVKSWPHAGCSADDLAAWIKKELEGQE